MVTHSLDERDREILRVIQRDASLPQAEIARRVGLSAAAVNERLRKLENGGVIRGWTVRVDPAAIGVHVTAFVELLLEHARFEKPILARILEMADVLECHHITGEFSLLLKVRVPDMPALQRVLLHELGAQEGVGRTRTVMVLSTAKEDTFVNPNPPGETR